MAPGRHAGIREPVPRHGRLIGRDEIRTRPGIGARASRPTRQPDRPPTSSNGSLERRTNPASQWCPPGGSLETQRYQRAGFPLFWRHSRPAYRETRINSLSAYFPPPSLALRYQGWLYGREAVSRFGRVFLFSQSGTD